MITCNVFLPTSPYCYTGLYFVLLAAKLQIFFYLEFYLEQICKALQFLLANSLYPEQIHQTQILPLCCRRKKTPDCVRRWCWRNSVTLSTPIEPQKWTSRKPFKSLYNKSKNLSDFRRWLIRLFLLFNIIQIIGNCRRRNYRRKSDLVSLLIDKFLNVFLRVRSAAWQALYKVTAILPDQRLPQAGVFFRLLHSDSTGV